MTKDELVKTVSYQTGVEIATVSAVVESTMKSIKISLIKKEPVFLRGFGTFFLKTRKTKTARNIIARTTIIVPEHVIPYFKPSRLFKDAILK